jgi:hypothetical protein
VDSYKNDFLLKQAAGTLKTDFECDDMVIKVRVRVCEKEGGGGGVSLYVVYVGAWGIGFPAACFSIVLVCIRSCADHHHSHPQPTTGGPRLCVKAEACPSYCSS